MRALFVGGIVDNSELDLDPGAEPPSHYPDDTGSGQPRYRLYRVGRRGREAVFAVYAAPELDPARVEQVVGERDYDRRFGADG